MPSGSEGTVLLIIIITLAVCTVCALVAAISASRRGRNIIPAAVIAPAHDTYRDIRLTLARLHVRLALFDEEMRS